MRFQQRFTAVLGLLAAAASPVACGGSGGAQPSSGTQTTARDRQTPPVVGESCVTGDNQTLCLALHFVSYQDAQGKPVVTADQAAAVVHVANEIWSQCGVGFQIETYESVDPVKLGLHSGAQAYEDLGVFPGAVAAIPDELLVVSTESWQQSIDGWTFFPDSPIHGTIVDAYARVFGGGAIYAHELGHYLGLQHVKDDGNLMLRVDTPTSTTLTARQCGTAVAAARDYWPAMARD